MSLLSELRSVISLVENILSGFFLDFEQDCGPWKWHSSVYSILEIIIY